MTARRLTLGRVAGVFGVRGWVKIHSFTRPVTNLLKYPRWWIVPAAPGEGFETKLIDGQDHGKSLVAQITGKDGAPIADRDVAAALLGAEVQVERTDLPKLRKKGEYYWVDLVGLSVENTLGEALGTVADMTSNGAQDVMVVNDGERERLIPFVHDNVVKKVDMKAGRIICDWAQDW